jgi:hypothetical protein
MISRLRFLCDGAGEVPAKCRYNATFRDLGRPSALRLDSTKHRLYKTYRQTTNHVCRP